VYCLLKEGDISSQAPPVNATVEVFVKIMVAVKKMQQGIIIVSAKEDLQVLCYVYNVRPCIWHPKIWRGLKYLYFPGDFCGGILLCLSCLEWIRQ
jgi:hypothetical protein